MDLVRKAVRWSWPTYEVAGVGVCGGDAPFGDVFPWILSNIPDCRGSDDLHGKSQERGKITRGKITCTYLVPYPRVANLPPSVFPSSSSLTGQSQRRISPDYPRPCNGGIPTSFFSFLLYTSIRHSAFLILCIPSVILFLPFPPRRRPLKHLRLIDSRHFVLHVPQWRAPRAFRTLEVQRCEITVCLGLMLTEYHRQTLLCLSPLLPPFPILGIFAYFTVRRSSFGGWDASRTRPGPRRGGGACVILTGEDAVSRQEEDGQAGNDKKRYDEDGGA